MFYVAKFSWDRRAKWSTNPNLRKDIWSYLARDDDHALSEATRLAGEMKCGVVLNITKWDKSKNKLVPLWTLNNVQPTLTKVV